MERLLRPFFSGVVLEEELTTSSRFVDLMLRMFARGSSVVPAGGMQQIAEQIASRLRVEWKGVTTVYHAAPSAPLAEPTLLLDTDESPINNTVVVTAAAPSYSPDHRALVATSMVHGVRERWTETAIRSRLSALYGVPTDDWEHLATYDIPEALPAMSTPHDFRKPVRQGELYVCGDHRDTSSIQGALVSGERAAAAVVSDLDLTPIS